MGKNTVISDRKEVKADGIDSVFFHCCFIYPPVLTGENEATMTKNCWENEVRTAGKE